MGVVCSRSGLSLPCRYPKKRESIAGACGFPFSRKWRLCMGLYCREGFWKAPSLCGYWAVNVVAVSELMVTVYSVPGS